MAQAINTCCDAREKDPGAITGQHAQQALLGGTASSMYAGHDMTTTILT